MADGQIVFEISVDGKHAIADVKDVTRAIETETRKWENSASNASDDMTKSFNKAFNTERLKNWSIQAAKALIDFGKAAIEASSDLEEVQNVVDVTFGDNAAQINSWAKQAIAQFGLTETKAKQFASTLGAMMKSSGVASKDIVSMSEDLAGLAADMASFYNLDFDTAFQKIRSGISGETEPLKQLGINMSVANLNAFALKQGLEKTFEQMTQGEQTMLRYEYLMSATADAQGDFARTSDGLANSSRLLASNVEALKTKFGELLVGPLANLTTWANTTLSKFTTPSSTTVLDTFNSIDIDTANKLADIERVSNDALDLIGVLNSINSHRVESEGLSGFVSAFSGSLTELDSAIAAAKDGNLTGAISDISNALELKTGVSSTNWSNLLTAISGNLPGVTDATGKDTSTSAFLSAAADAANKLGGQYPALWKQLLEAMGEDAAVKALQSLAQYAQGAGTLGVLAIGANKLNDAASERWGGLISTFSGMSDFATAVNAAKTGDYAGTISGLADALSKTTGFKKGDWETLLSEIGNKLPAANNAADGEKVSGFLSAAAAAADDLGGEYPAMWQALIDTLGSDKAAAMISSLAGGQSAGTYLGEIAKSANKLNADSQDHWGALLTSIQKVTGGMFGNNAKQAQTRINELAEALSGKSLDTNRGAAFKELITTLTSNVDSLSGLSGDTAEGTAKFLETIGKAADELDPNDAKGWDTLLTALATGLSGGIGTDAGNTFYDTMSQYFLAMGADSEVAVAGLKAMGMESEDIEQAQKDWLTTCKELVRTIPSLGSVINTQTGEVKGGTDAIQAHIEAWRKEQEAMVAWSAYYAKQNALEQAKADLFGQRLTAGTKQQAVDRLSKEIASVYGDASIKALEEYRRQYRGVAVDDNFIKRALQAAGIRGASAETRAAVKELILAMDEMIEAGNEYEKQEEAIAKAEQELQDQFDYTEKEYGEYADAAKGAADGVRELTDAEQKAAEAAPKAVDNLRNSLSEMLSYMQQVKESTRSAVDSVVTGFSEIVTPVAKARKEIEELTSKIAKATGEAKAGLIEQRNAKYGEMPTLANMKAGLQSQLDYMREYTRLMEEARAKGVSEEILSMLADGSTESFDYLKVLATEGGNIDEINRLYADVQKQAEAFTDTLTEQKLSTDETLQGIADKVNEMVAAVDLGDEAKQAAIHTMEGLLAGLQELEPSIADQVAEIMSIIGQLGTFTGFQLTGTTVSYSSGASGKAIGRRTNNGAVRAYAIGTDYVPADGLAFLHEGEAILNGEEARVWRNMMYGQNTQNVDYDALGSTIRDNSKGGGNVYLDGRTVGQIISDRQGASYRALERSGWQR